MKKKHKGIGKTYRQRCSNSPKGETKRLNAIREKHKNRQDTRLKNQLS